MAYATVAQMAERFDVLRLGELVRDDGSRATLVELATDENLAAALSDASGKVRSAVLVGERYTTDDLDDLTGDSAALLVRIACDLTYGLLLRRKGYPADQIANLAPGYIEAEQYLELLNQGKRVFEVDEVLDAGSAVEVTTLDINNVFLLTAEAQRLFGLARSTPNRL